MTERGVDGFSSRFIGPDRSLYRLEGSVAPHAGGWLGRVSVDAGYGFEVEFSNPTFRDEDEARESVEDEMRSIEVAVLELGYVFRDLERVSLGGLRWI